MIAMVMSCLMAVSLEIAGLLVALRAEPALAQLLYFLLAHLLASITLCLCIPDALSRRHPALMRLAGTGSSAGQHSRDSVAGVAQPGASGKPPGASSQAGGGGKSLAWIVFMVCFFIPGCGIFGILLAMLPALCYPARQQAQPTWHRSCLHLSASTAVSGQPASSLKGILEQAGDPQRRLQALIATLSLDDLRAAPLLRIALKDADDEVRLLSYALITRKEKTLEESVKLASSRLELADPDQRFQHHRSLAHHFWEMANVAGDADGARQFHELARSHAELGLVAWPGDGTLQFLLGRIQLKLLRGEPAERAFLQAVDAGVDYARVRPFLAELAFLQRRFHDVGALLAPVNGMAASLSLARQHGYWKEARP